MFLTFFIMSPVITEINEKALQPYLEKKLTQSEAIAELEKPIRKWMLAQTKEEELKLLIEISKMKRPKTIPMSNGPRLSSKEPKKIPLTSTKKDCN